MILDESIQSRELETTMVRAYVEGVVVGIVASVLRWRAVEDRGAPAQREARTPTERSARLAH